MRIRKRSQSGQGVMGQYALVFFFVLAAITAMSVYVRRGLQARTYGAREYLVSTIESETGLDVADGYEPYYVNRVVIKESTGEETVSLAGKDITRSFCETTITNLTNN